MSSIPNIVVMDAEELVACRICLVGEGNLYDIHEWGLAQSFTKIMGIPVKGRVPQYLCTWCRTLLAKAWSLREKCHRADALLMKMNQKRYVSNASIRSVDRSANLLTHTLTQTLLTDAQYYYTHPDADSDGQLTVIKPSEDQPGVISDDDSDRHFDSVEPCIVIDGESNEPRITIGDKKDKKPSKSQPRVPIDHDSSKKARFAIGGKGYKQLKTNKLRIFIENTSNKQPPITIGGAGDKKPLKSKPRIIIAGRSNKRPPLIIEDKITEKPLISDEIPLTIEDDDDNLCDDEPSITVNDKSDQNITNELTYYVIEGDNIESAVKINASDLIADVANHNDSDEPIEMTPFTQTIENETNSAAKFPSAVVKKNNIYGIPTIEECEVYAKKYNFTVQRLTNAEMLEDMELRRTSDRYKIRRHKCDLCYRGFMTSTTLENHMNKYHNRLRNSDECELCKVSFSTDLKLVRHMWYSHEVRYTCAECGYIAWDKRECLNHAMKHGLRECRFCEKSFRNGSTFAWHMRVAHSLENAASGSCEECGEIFAGRQGLRSHKLLQHKKVPTAPGLQCKRCRVVFDSEEARRVHSEETSGRCDLSMSACNTCGLDCADADDLLLHMRDEHQLPVHTCDECSKLFRTEKSLSTHVDRVHRGIPLKPPSKPNRYQNQQTEKKVALKDHMCEHCGRVFHCRAVLKTHLMKHSGERPHECSLCPKAYITAKELKQHMDVHAGLRKYRCAECPKTFLRPASVYKHRLVHTGERPFTCDICKKTFNQSGSLSSHIKYVHMNETPPPRRRRGPTEA